MAGWTALVSAPLAIASSVLLVQAVHGRLDVFSNPLELLQVGAAGASLLRWSMIADLFGYYLLIVPLVLYLQGAGRQPRDSWRSLFGVSLLGYSLIGAIGAALLAISTANLISAYPQAVGAMPAALTAVANAQSDEVYHGLWNLLEVFLAGVGWIGFGLDLRRARPVVATLSILAGAGGLIDCLGSIANAASVSMVGLNIYLVAAPLWAAWAGMTVIRRPLDALPQEAS